MIPAVEVLGASLEVARPWVLPLLPLLFLLWWLRVPNRTVVPVASTFLWRRILPGERRALRSPLRLLILLCLALAAAHPCLFPSADSRPPELPLARVLGSRAPNGPARIEAILPPGTGSRTIEVRSGSERIAGVTLELDPQWPTSWQAVLAGCEADRAIEISVAGKRIPLAEPVAYRPVRVRDESGSPRVAHALDALESEGWIVRGDGPGSVLVTTRERDAMATSAILFAAEDDAATALFPLPEPVSEAEPLLAGLDVRSWSIERARTSAATIVARSPSVLVDSADAPLLTAGPNLYRFAFLPEESDLPLRAEWPVLLGRMLVSLSPPPIAGENVARLPARLPQWALLGAAMLVAVASYRWRAREPILLAVAAIAALACAVPELPHGDVAVVRASGADRGTEWILDAARRLSGGGVVEIEERTPLPLLAERLLPALAARRVELRFATVAAATVLRATPARTLLGGRVTLDILGPVAAGSRLEVLAPDGTRREIPGADAPARSIEVVPDAAGYWHYRLLPGDEFALVAVEEPPRALRVAGSAESGARALLEGSDFRVETWDPALPLEDVLPNPPARSVVLWDGAEPEHVGAAGIAALGRWLDAGGTLFTAVGPPFFEPSLEKDALDALLPRPLPAPPRRSERALGIVLVDLSGSMRHGAAFEALSAGVLELLASTPPGGRWGIAYFRENAGWIAPPGTPVDRALLARFATAASSAAGGTRLDLGLEFVLRELGAAEAGSALVVLSDGKQLAGTWRDVGRRLRGAGVRVVTVSVGSDATEETLRALAASSGGSHFRAPTALDAVRALHDLVEAPPGPWRTPAGEMHRVSPDPLLSRLPIRLPAPRRVFAAGGEIAGRLLWLDAEGRPLLGARERGRGRALLWWSGLDRESIPEDGAGARLARALRSVLAAAARADPLHRRSFGARYTAGGGRWITADRGDREPAVVAVRFPNAGGSERAGRAVAYAPDRYAIPEPIPPPTCVEWTEGRVYSALASPSAARAEREALARATAGFAPERARIPIDAPLLVAAIALAAAGGRARRFRERSSRAPLAFDASTRMP